MGSFYQMTFADKDGGPLDGGMIYRLRVPPNPPVNLYWSATVYDRATHASVRDMKWSSRSQPDGFRIETDFLKRVRNTQRFLRSGCAVSSVSSTVGALTAADR